MPSLRATSCSRYICSIGTRSGAGIEEVIERFLLTDLALPFMCLSQLTIPPDAGATHRSHRPRKSRYEEVNESQTTDCEVPPNYWAIVAELFLGNSLRRIAAGLGRREDGSLPPPGDLLVEGCSAPPRTVLSA